MCQTTRQTHDDRAVHGADERGRPKPLICTSGDPSRTSPDKSGPTSCARNPNVGRAHGEVEGSRLQVVTRAHDGNYGLEVFVTGERDVHVLLICVAELDGGGIETVDNGSIDVHRDVDLLN